MTFDLNKLIALVDRIVDRETAVYEAEGEWSDTHTALEQAHICDPSFYRAEY